MNANKILISENTELHKTLTKELNNYRNALAAAAELYAALDLGKITEEVAKLIRSTSGGSKIETLYWDTLKEQLDKSGVVNKVLRNTVLNGSKDPIEQFMVAYRHIHSLNLTHRDILKYIVFNGFNFELTKGYGENILEDYCREYLADEAEKAFLATLTKLESAIVAYREELKKVNANHGISRSLAQLDHVLKPTPQGDWIADATRAVYFHRAAKRNMRTNDRVF